MPDNAEPKIAVAGLSKQFGSKQVLRSIDLDVPAGKKTVIIGPAASGKSVLMKCLAGIHRPETGTVKIDGIDTIGADARQHAGLMQSVGVLFQQGGLFDSLSVWENIGFKLIYSMGVSRQEARAVAVDKLAKVNLPATTADLLPAELSGGMQKRVGIARALAGDPSLLLLDEPTAGLDPITSSVINRLIDRSIHETGATVLSITSDMQSVKRDYDYLAMLHEGELVWKGPLDAMEASGNAHVLQLVNGRAQGPIKMRLRSRAAS